MLVEIEEKGQEHVNIESVDMEKPVIEMNIGMGLFDINGIVPDLPILDIPEDSLLQNSLFDFFA